MTPDGYGVAYAQLESRMNILITAWHSCAETSAAKFRDELTRTLIEMRTVCTAALVEPASKL